MVTDDPAAQALLQHLAQRAKLVLGSPPVDDEAAFGDGGRVVMLVRSPAWALARRAIEPGGDPAPGTAATLAQWVEEGGRHLQHLLAHRESSLAFDVQEFLEHPHAAMTRICSWLGLEAPAALPVPTTEPPDPLLLRLCTETASAHRQAMDLHAELLACCEPLPAPAGPGAAEPALDAWIRMHRKIAVLTVEQHDLAQASAHRTALEAELVRERAGRLELEALVERTRAEYQAAREAALQERQREAAAAAALQAELGTRHQEERARWVHDRRLALDELHAEVSRLQQALATTRAALLSEQDRQAPLRNALVDAQKALTASEARHRADTTANEQTLRELQQRAAEFEGRLSSWQTEAERAGAETRHARAQAAQAHLETQEALQQAQLAQRQVLQARNEAEQAQAELQQSQAQMQQARADAAQAEARAAQLLATLEQSQAEAERARTEGQLWREALHDAQELIEQLTLAAQAEPPDLRAAHDRLAARLAAAEQQLTHERTRLTAAAADAQREYDALLAHLHVTQELLDGAVQQQAQVEQRQAWTESALQSAVATRPLLWRGWRGDSPSPLQAELRHMQLLHAGDAPPHRELVLEWPEARIAGVPFAPLRLKLVEHQGRAGIAFVRRAGGPAALGRWQPNAREGHDELMLFVPSDAATWATLDHLGASDWLVLLDSASLLEQAVGHLASGIGGHWSAIASRLLVELKSWPERLRYDAVSVSVQGEAGTRVRIEGVLIGTQPGPALQLRWQPQASRPTLVLELDALRPHEPPLACWPASADGRLQQEFAIPVGSAVPLRERVRWWTRLRERDRMVVGALLDVLEASAPGQGPAMEAWSSAARRLRAGTRRSARLASLAARLVR